MRLHGRERATPGAHPAVSRLIFHQNMNDRNDMPRSSAAFILTPPARRRALDATGADASHGPLRSKPALRPLQPAPHCDAALCMHLEWPTGSTTWPAFERDALDCIELAEAWPARHMRGGTPIAALKLPTPSHLAVEAEYVVSEKGDILDGSPTPQPDWDCTLIR